LRLVVTSAGNEQADPQHPGLDDVSPDCPPGSAEERYVRNNCRVAPTELPGVLTVSATGPVGYPGYDLWIADYSSVGMSRVDVAATPAQTSPGTAVTLTATIADQRYGSDLPQPIAAAEYFLDAPGADGTGVTMLPGDGMWGGLSEEVKAVVDTTALPLGRHYLLVHGRNASGDWGPFSAKFLTVSGPPTLFHLPLVVRGTES
jgi:hypothetical protein